LKVDFDRVIKTRSELVQWLLDCEVIRHGQGIEYMTDSEVEQIAKESVLWQILELLHTLKI
jgi:hypothetical protein